jgi:hypothetical protein
VLEDVRTWAEAFALLVAPRPFLDKEVWTTAIQRWKDFTVQVKDLLDSPEPEKALI